MIGIERWKHAILTITDGHNGFLFNYLIALFLFGSILMSSKNTIFDRIRGFEIFSKELYSIINEKNLVVSDRMIFANLSYGFRNQPNNLYMPYNDGQKITNHFQMTSSLKKENPSWSYPRIIVAYNTSDV